MSAAGAKARLANDFKHLKDEKWCNVELGRGDNLMKWTIGLMVINKDSDYNGAYFKCEMNFSSDYPMRPPSFKFTRPIFHPNIYTDGRVCISILHAPGEDIMSGETASERWNPLHSPESILRSILVMLDSPEISSPANVDASVLYRDNRVAYKKRAAEDVERSKEDIPADFTMPSSFEDAPPPKAEYDHDFMFDSDIDEDEDDFGASDSDADMTEADDGDQEIEDSDDEGGNIQTNAAIGASKSK